MSAPLPLQASDVAARLPQWPLPAVRYIPGRSPHPKTLPPEPTPELPAASAWWDDARFLRGLDLFDAQYYWEAHEVWESLWLELPRAEAPARLIQGLIQGAAAVVKRQQGDRTAAASLTRAALARLDEAASAAVGQPGGLNLPALRAAMVSFGAGEPVWPHSRGAAP